MNDNETDSNLNQNYNNYSDYQQPAGYVSNTNTPEPTGSNGMAIASLVLSILSILTVCCVCPTFIFSGLGIIFGLLSKGGAPKRDTKATVGIVISSIALVLAIIVGILYFVAATTSGEMNSYMQEYMKDYPEYYNLQNTL